ncbi:MAG TPA: HupE/UreJ family protein [Longimicrobiales bacterium]|nr:HupE/UreJ family protein [Longimicrobiales bacterium]
MGVFQIQPAAAGPRHLRAPRGPARARADLRVRVRSGGATSRWRLAAAPGAAAACCTLLLLAAPAPAAAHEIPAEVVVRILVGPAQDGRLPILVRVPMEALRDVEYPVRGPERYLDLAAAEPRLRDAARLWVADYLEVREDGRALARPEVVAIRVSLPTDRSFASWESALAAIRGPPLPASTDLVPGQGLLDVLLEVPLRAGASGAFSDDVGDLALVPTLAHLGIRTTTVLTYRAPDGAERTLRLAGDPGVVRLDPRWHHAALSFLALGMAHILGGFDHLLFLLALVAPFRRVRPLVGVVTAFTLGHSLTLGAAALGLVPGALWFPALVETLIALSIVWMALENIAGARLERRWAMAFGFGLVHGFGFSFLLTDSLQLAGGHLLAALLAFNVGVELGQILVLAVAVPLLALLCTRVVPDRMGTILISALVAHSGWHWMTERGGALLQYDVRLPALDLFLAASLLRWAVLALLVVAAGWLAGSLARRLGTAASPGAVPAGVAARLDPSPRET